MNFALQALGQYKESEQASALKQRDYKDATDLILNGGGRQRDLNNEKGGDEMDGEKTVVRRLTPL